MAVLDHVGIRVTDLDRAIAFYSEMFGFKLAERRMLSSETPVEAAAMQVGPQNLIFLLYNPEFVAFPPHVDGRPDHFCIIFEPDEFDQVMERLRGGGVLERLDCALQPRTGATGRSPSQYILDPDNNQIEVKVHLPVGQNGTAHPSTVASAH